SPRPTRPMSIAAERLPRPWLALALLAAWTAPARAQAPPQIEKVRIGLPAGKAGQDAGRSRNGAWAPGYLTLKAGRDGNPQRAHRLVLEPTDSEDDLYRYSVPVPSLSAGDAKVVIAYTLPSSDGSEFTGKLEAVGSKRALQVLPRLTRDSTQDEVVGPNDALFLLAGGGLSLVRKAGEELDKPAAKPAAH